MSDTNGDGHVVPSETVSTVLNSLYPRGYVFFGICENGKIDTIVVESDPIQSIGLQSYIVKWGEAQDNISSHMVMQACIDGPDASDSDEQSLQE